MKILKNFDLSRYLSMHAGPVLKEAFVIEQEAEIPNILKGSRVPYRMLGKGTNTLISPDQKNRIWLINQMSGWNILEKDLESVLVRVQSGTELDDLIREMTDRGYGGMESLSGIPGSAGGAVVMNAGAYGHEIREVIESVRVYDRKKDAIHTLSADDCAFGYRSSIFQKEPERWFILSLDLKLQCRSARSLQKKREEVLLQRSFRVPALKDFPSCGSFFRNPVISRKKAESLKEKIPDVKIYPFDAYSCKVSAGSLIRHCYPEEAYLHGVLVKPEHPLILINVSAAYENILEAWKELREKVSSETGIRLEPEVCLA
jgi:UDP-N-acetylmuramate dehydrogenase